MKLSVLERVHLLSVLPKEGNLITLRIVQDLKHGLGFSEEEIKETGMNIGEDGYYHWEKNIDKEVEIGEKGFDILKTELTAKVELLDKEGKLNMQILDLYDRFVTP